MREIETASDLLAYVNQQIIDKTMYEIGREIYPERYRAYLANRAIDGALADWSTALTPEQAPKKTKPEDISIPQKIGVTALVAVAVTSPWLLEKAESNGWFPDIYHDPVDGGIRLVNNPDHVPAQYSTVEAAADLYELEELVSTLGSLPKSYLTSSSNGEISLFAYPDSNIRFVGSEKIQLSEARSLTELQDIASPLFESIGTNLIIIDSEEDAAKGETSNRRFDPLSEEDLPFAIQAISVIEAQLRDTPHDLYQFADISEIRIVKNLTNGTSEARWAGMSYDSWPGMPDFLNDNTILLDIAELLPREDIGHELSEAIFAQTFLHEMAHGIIKRFDEDEQANLIRIFMELNPEWFKYSENAGEANRLGITTSVYGASDVIEDIAETLAQLKSPRRIPIDGEILIQHYKMMAWLKVLKTIVPDYDLHLANQWKQIRATSKA